MKNQFKSLSKRKKAFVIGVGVALAGAISYFGWRYFKRRSAASEAIIDSSPEIFPDRSLPAAANDNFPLKKGSKGAKVKAFQNALIARFGKSILPKFGADGDFGSEMTAALKRADLPAQIDEATYNDWVGGTSDVDGKKVALNLYKGIVSRNYIAAITAVKQISSVADYKTVSASFKNYKINGVVQTIVTALTGTFNTSIQKQELKDEFERIGLKYDGNKWSLSGIELPLLITTQPTTVWKDKKTSVPVPVNMVLGREVSRKVGFVLFENAGRNFLVAASAVTSFNQ